VLTNDNLFGGLRRPWWKCFAIAVSIEGVIVLLLASQFFGFAPLIAVGADNPFTGYLAFALQLPASLLFAPLFSWAHSIGLSENSSIIFAAAPIAVVELLLLAVFLRGSGHRRRDKTEVV
jgi:drug/metabolite transporter (DMT)-like permease